MPARNDPCPCGSGRKYKHCCQGKDQAPALSQVMRTAAARAAVWEVDAIPVMARFSDEQARPVMLLVTAGDVIVHQDIRSRLRGGAAPVAAALERAIAAAVKATGQSPQRVRMRDPETADALAPLLAPHRIHIEIGETPALQAVALELQEHVFGGGTWPPSCRNEVWSAWELPPALVKDLFAAAAAFYRDAPWRDVANLQAPRVRLPSGRSWTACVLGGAGEQFGLALYSEPSDLFDVLAHGDPSHPFGDVRGRIVAVTFDSLREVDPEAVRDARVHRRELAGPSAYPVLTTVNTPGGGATPEDIEDLVLVLGAAPRFVARYRIPLRREERTGEPAEPIAWTDRATRVSFRYEGEGALADLDEAGDTEDDGVLEQLQAELEAEIGKASAELEGGGQAVFDAVLQRAAAATMAAHNDRPVPEFGGLTPAQVQRLLSADWNRGDGAVRMRRDLALEDVAHADLVTSARALLGRAIEQGGLGLTQAGNLKLAEVAALLDHVKLESTWLELRRQVGGRISEQDVWPLHKIRLVCGLAGLLRRRKQQLEPTKAARQLVPEEAAGELYARLFHAWFRKFNIGYGGRTEWPELQHQVAYTLSRLPTAAAQWRSAEELLPEVVLPYAFDSAPGNELVGSLAAIDLAVHVLDPLVGFGLVERQSGGRPRRFGEDRYRSTPLAARFLEFDI